jgi:hypothetical protein
MRSDYEGCGRSPSLIQPKHVMPFKGGHHLENEATRFGNTFWKERVGYAKLASYLRHF